MPSPVPLSPTTRKSVQCGHGAGYVLQCSLCLNFYSRVWGWWYTMTSWTGKIFAWWLLCYICLFLSNPYFLGGLRWPPAPKVNSVAICWVLRGLSKLCFRILDPSWWQVPGFEWLCQSQGAEIALEGWHGGGSLRVMGFVVITSISTYRGLGSYSFLFLELGNII